MPVLDPATYSFRFRLRFIINYMHTFLMLLFLRYTQHCFQRITPHSSEFIKQSLGIQCSYYDMECRQVLSTQIYAIDLSSCKHIRYRLGSPSNYTLLSLQRGVYAYRCIRYTVKVSQIHIIIRHAKCKTSSYDIPLNIHKHKTC